MPYFRTVESPAMPVVEMEGAPRIMLASNNYLGLTGDERVMQGARDALARYGTGLTGSRLLNGTTPLHLELERELAEWMETDDAIVFTTGHQANVGTLGTLLDAKDTVIVDSADHASILDGVLLSKAKMRPFRHNRMDKLERALERAEGDGGGVLVVVDGVFSMEGDVAPLVDIVELCKRHGARLMVDEAHGAGVLGARGAGACGAAWRRARVDLRMGTFSKSLAACGGFVAGSAEVIDYLRISSRAFLFTASAVPAALGRGALGAAHHSLRARVPRCSPRCSRTRAISPTGCTRSATARCGRAGSHADRQPDSPTTQHRHPDRACARGRRLEGGAAVAGALRQRACSPTARCTPPCRPAARCCARA